MWSKFYLYWSWAKLYCRTKETPSWTKWVTRVRMKKRNPLRQVTCPISICKQVQRVLQRTPRRSRGMILAWDTKVTSPLRCARTSGWQCRKGKEDALRTERCGLCDSTVLITSSCCRSWIILSDYQIASQSNRQEGHLTRVPSLGWCPSNSLLVLPSPVTIIK